MNKTRNLKYACNVAGFSIIAFLAIREICGAVMANIPFKDGSVMPFVLGIAVFAAACLIPTITMENALGLHPKLFRKTDTATTLAAVFYGYLLIIAASFANSLVLALLKKAGLEFAAQTVSIPQKPLHAVLYFAYVCLLPPLLEEIFTRGYLLNAFKNWGRSFAIVVSSLCFALLHSSMENFVVYFCCGIILAQVYLTFDSLLPAMLLHCLNNSISFFMLAFQGRANAHSALVLIIFVYVCAIIFGYAGKKHLDSRGIKLSACFEKDSDLLKKFIYCRKAYMAVAALGLMVFFALLGSYNSLV
ncbi:MAG: CPBP family intramembrane metalloprotease [Ruminococcaceae bacterium]|nr:CPBP family intramembrane metalloprotease [Oscillospiraceae bacterium]